VFLSSHLLDEVERICDREAFVDHGRVVTEVSIAELTAEGGSRLIVGVDDPDRAYKLLEGHPAVVSSSIDSGRLHLTVEPGRESAAAINRLLVESGLGVHQLAPAQATLEQRFLEITSRLGDEQEAEG
jgi:ABC-2 type transport system ATP-binding protein